ncbi:MAG: leucine-rich repeat domain-containing protein [Planctomycetia bacterium]|nr:leucine-rich repeat domain-containing protein [Planctomycetia bacterium]
MRNLTKIALVLFFMVGFSSIFASRTVCGDEVAEEEMGNRKMPSPASDFEYVRCDNQITITASRIREGEVAVPDEIEGLPVTKIGDSAFRGYRDLTSVHLPKGITIIKNNTFSNCQRLSSVNIPKMVTEIERCAFMGCISLREIMIPESVEYVGNMAFFNCSELKITGKTEVLKEEEEENKEYWE